MKVLEGLGYNKIVILQDCLTFIAGIIIGIMVMGLLTANFISKVEKISDGNKRIKMVRVTHKGVSKYIASFSTFKETLELVFIMAFSPLLTKRTYSLRDERRTKIFLFILAILGTIILAISLWSILTVYAP